MHNTTHTSPVSSRFTKRKGGFTLVEVIVAVAIMAVLLAIGISAVAGYIVASEMIELNQNAKTIYMVAQDYLTQAAAGGGLDPINQTAHAVTDTGSIVPALGTDEARDNKDNLVYLHISKNGADDAALLAMLQPYVSDPNILQQSVLVEYNKNTGVVRSVFYSKTADALAYTGDAADKGNVLNRNEDALRKKRQGYYGVDYTGNLKNGAAIASTKPVFVNSDRLTLEWNDTTPTTGDLKKTLTFTVTIYSEDFGTEYLRLENVPNPAMISYPNTKAESEKTNNFTAVDTYWNGTLQTEEANRKHSLSVRTGDKPGDPQKMVLILDDIHRAIYETYPNIPLGNLSATVEPSAEWIKVIPGQTEKPAHSYFASAKKDAGKDTVTYQIEYARQLNNIRHAAPNSNYSIPKTTTYINWAAPEGETDTNPVLVDFEVVNFQYRTYADDGTFTENEDIDGYRGTFAAETSATIANLNIVPASLAHIKKYKDSYDLTVNLGMFAQLAKGATVKNLKLNKVELNPTHINKDKNYSNVGALAGKATEATIDNVRVESGTVIANSVATVTPEKKNAYTGGVIGYAQKCTMSKLFNGAKVQSGSHTNAAMPVQNGRDCVGGVIGYMKDGTLTGTTATQNTAGVFGGNNVGGIVGSNDGGNISQPYNTGKYVVGLDNVGGIVGNNIKGTVTQAKNVNTKLDADAALVGVFNELKNPATFEANLLRFNESFVGVLGRENVGGILGLNDTGGTLSGFSTKQTIKGGSNTGGIVGSNKGKMTWTDAGKTSEGIVICAGSYAGGILGVNANSTVALTNLVNNAHVVAKEYAGGIIGSNGDAGSGMSTRTTISNCANQGAVFAYKQYGGGIAGRNLGNIRNCESSAGNAEALDKKLTAAGIAYGDYVGGITGYNNGEITDCSNANLVKGKDFVGGITGHNDAEGYIYSCKTLGGRVIGTGNFVGGFIGLNTSGQLTQDKGMGGLLNLATLVKGKQFVGGVIGCNLFTSGNLTIQANNGNVRYDKEDARQTVVEGDYYVGGIIGYNCMKLDLNQLPNPEAEDRPGAYNGSGEAPQNQTKLNLCNNYGQVKTLRYGGGIIGLNSAESALVIEKSSNSGVIAYSKYSEGTFDANKSYYIAGITGRNTRTGVIDDCINSGKVLSRSKYTGGLVEVNEGLMKNCKNAGQVLAEQSNYVGGIAGYNITAGNVANGTDGKATILNCSTTEAGRVSGVNYVGGIVGANAAVLEKCVLMGSTNYANETYHVYGKEDCVGGIVGFNQTKGSMEACSTEGGSVRGRNFVGGLVGYTNSAAGLSGKKAMLTTTYTQNGSRVYGDSYVGGISGALAESITLLEYCANTEFGRVIGAGTQTSGTVTLKLEERDANNNDITTTLSFDRGNMGVGGIVGVVRTSDTLKNCYNNGVVVGAGAQTGGITGLNLGTVEACVNRGIVKGSSQAASLALRDDLSKILNDKNQVGGIAGRSTGTLSACAAEQNNVSAAGNKESLVAGRWDVGGIVGLLESGTVIEPKVQSDAVQVTGFGRTGGLIGRWAQNNASLQLEDKNITATVTGTTAGQNMTPNSTNQITVGGVFGQIDSGSAGTVEKPTVVADGYTFSGTVKLNTATADWQYAGGIVPKISEKQSVKNCILTGAVSSAVTATTNTGAGGIVGENAGRVESCTLKKGASVTGDSKLGGIIGENAAQGTMLNCLNEEGANVNGAGSMIGGYMGRNKNPTALVRSSATDIANNNRLVNFAQVIGGQSVGGIVGDQTGSMTACDNKAAVQIYKYYGGGVAGKLNSAANAGYTVQDCVNYGSILLLNIGTENDGGTGGVVGLMDTAKNATNGLTVENCRNEGAIEVPNVRPGTVLNVYARYVGGVVGQARSGSTVKNSSNTKNGSIVYFPGSGLYNGNGTAASVGGAGVGGVVGLATNTARVEKCENLGELTLAMKQPKNAQGADKESISPEGVAFGGVVGSLKGNSFAIDCTNKGKLVISADNKYHGIGGVVGSAYSAPAQAPSGTLQNCVNESPIQAEMSYAVGGVLGLSSGAQVDTCTNEAAVSAMGQVGGIVGALYRDSFNTPQNNTIQSSTNKGMVSNNPGNLALSADAIGGILGDVGANESRVTIKDCTNEGSIQPRATEKNTFNGAGGILGKTSFGAEKNQLIQVLNSKNSALISPAPGTDGRKVGLGGIVGDASRSVLVKDCVNTGEVTDGGLGTYESVGGIVGNVNQKDSLVINCKNHASVTATNGTANGIAVGGIVGRNAGIVASSANVALAGALDVPQISGRADVGGIVGVNNSETAFIYSTPGVAGTQVTTINEMPVEATAGDAGGIAGKNMSGGVVDTFNTGNVTATAAAGGIIGTATTFSEGVPPVSQTAGQLANSCSIGTVKGKENGTGGVIGVRNVAYDSVESHNIKMAFYLYETSPSNVVGPILSVGNEPEQDKTIGENDSPLSTKPGADRRLSASLFNDNGIDVPDFGDITDLRGAIAKLQEVAKYHLEQPRKVTTISTSGYEYTTNWEMVQGLVDHYEVYLRKKGETSEDINPEMDIKIGESSKNEINGRLETFLTFNIRDLYNNNAEAFTRIYGSATPTINSFEDMIGCEFDVVVKTISKKSEVQNGPKDSLGRTSEKDRKMLPVLPTPDTTKQSYPGKIYELTINSERYAPQLDRTVYKNLGANELYDMPQRNGVSQYLYQNVGAIVDSWQDTSIAPNVEPYLYQFKINHSNDFKDTTNPNRNIKLQALSNDTTNGYAHSEVENLTYKVQVRLNPPTNIQGRFSGTNAQAKYSLTWGSVPNNQGYYVQISYKDILDNTQTVFIRAPQNATQCEWSVPGDIASGSTASVTVKTLGENGLDAENEDQTYITSFESEPSTLTMPVKLNAPQMTFAQGTERDMDFTVQWTEASPTNLISKYVLSIQRYRIGEDPSTAVDYPFAVGGKATVDIEPSKTDYLFQFAEADFGYAYLVTMRAEGIKEKSLTSTNNTQTFLLYPRRTTTSVVTATRTGKTTFKFMWNGKTAADLDYPAEELSGAFQLRFSLVGASTATALVPVDTAQELRDGFAYTFTPEQGFVMGEQYQVELMALAVDGTYSRSLNSKTLQFFLPKPVPPVQGLQVKAQPDVDITQPRDITKYNAAQYTVSWNSYGTQSEIAGFSVSAFVTEDGVETDITGNLTWTPAQAELNPRSTSVLFDKLSAQYAGKKITLKVIAVGGTETSDSEPAVVEITVPKAKLEAPTVISVTQGTAETPSTKDVTITLDPTQTEVLQSIVDWKSKILHHTAHLNLVCDVPALDADDKPITVEKTLAFPMEIVDFVDTVTTADPMDETALSVTSVARTSFRFTAADLLAAIQVAYPELKLTEMPVIKPSSIASIFLTAVKTEKSGFTNSDGTDSTEDLPESALNAEQNFSLLAPDTGAPQSKAPVSSVEDAETPPQTDADLGTSDNVQSESATASTTPDAASSSSAVSSAPSADNSTPAASASIPEKTESSPAVLSEQTTKTNASARENAIGTSTNAGQMPVLWAQRLFTAHGSAAR